MNSIARWLSSIGLAAATATYPQKTLADGFDGNEFNGWSAEAQDSYIQTSVTMAAIIATKTRRAAGDCIDAWYLADTADRAARNAEIRDTIGRNAEFHPSAVIFLILETQCGSFS